MPYIRVLFLDDDEERHRSFETHRPHRDDTWRVTHVRTAAEAIAALGQREYELVFLDHDLSEGDVMVTPGGASHVPTGMDVVGHILTMQHPPYTVVVHSMNGPAAEEMVARLSGGGMTICVRRQFNQLMSDWRARRGG